MINIFHLKCFYDAAMMGNLSEAARRNFVSQPAVSKAIVNLEGVLGVSLCHHKKQQFKLTPEGEIVFSKCKEIFSAIRGLSDAVDQYKKQPRMPLHFVSTQSLALSILPDLIPDFQSAYPSVKLDFLLGGLSQIKGWLKQGIAEFALVIESPEVAEYEKISLYEGRFELYKHEKETKPIDSAKLYVEHQKGFLVSEYEERSEMDLKSAIELNSWELIARTIDRHGGYGLLPCIVLLTKRYPHLISCSSLYRNNLKNREFGKEGSLTQPGTDSSGCFGISLPYTICAIFPKGEKLSFSAVTFLQTLSSFLKKAKSIQDSIV